MAPYLKYISEILDKYVYKNRKKKNFKPNLTPLRTIFGPPKSTATYLATRCNKSPCFVGSAPPHTPHSGGGRWHRANGQKRSFHHCIPLARPCPKPCFLCFTSDMGQSKAKRRKVLILCVTR